MFSLYIFESREEKEKEKKKKMFTFYLFGLHKKKNGKKNVYFLLLYPH